MRNIIPNALFASTVWYFARSWQKLAINFWSISRWKGTHTLSVPWFIVRNKVENTVENISWIILFWDAHHHKMTQGNAKCLGVSYGPVKWFYRTIIWQVMRLPRQVIWIPFIVKQYIEDPLWDMIKLLLSLTSFSILSSHSCKYGSFIGLCPYRPWAICIYMCSWCYIFGFHGDAAAMFETH